MKYLKTYNQILEGKAEKKALEKISKFFKDEFIAKKAVDLSPKLSVWIVNQFKNQFMKSLEQDNQEDKFFSGDAPDISFEKDVENYFKTGKLDDKTIKFLSPLTIKGMVFNLWSIMSSDFQSVVDWSLSDDITPEEKAKIPKMTLEDAYGKSVEWHDSLIAGGVIEDEHGKVIMTFPDGFYWIDLETTSDDDEAEAMGHCGRTSKGDTLYSLRDRKKSPHVTAAIDSKEGIVYQMKGRNNKKPIDKYHPYIIALLMNDDLEPPLKGFGIEYDRREDFNPEEDLTKELYDKLKEKRPDIDAPAWDKEDIKRMFDNMITMYYLEDNDYGFNAVSWAYSLTKEEYGLDKIIDSMNKYSSVFFYLLCGEYPEKAQFNLDSLSKKDKVNLTDLLARDVSGDDTAKNYNITLPNPKASNREKWELLFKKLDNDKISEILIDNGILSKGRINTKDNLEIKFEKFGFDYTEELKASFNMKTYSRKDALDYKEIIDYFIADTDTEQEKVMEELERLLGSESDYRDEFWDIFISTEIGDIIIDNTTTKDMEDELSSNDWYEYTGDDY